MVIADSAVISNSLYNVDNKMAQLPYKITVERYCPLELEKIISWCHKQWPYTYGATWYYGLQCEPLIRPHLTPTVRYTQTVCFQREEDALCFSLAWS